MCYRDGSYAVQSQRVIVAGVRFLNGRVLKCSGNTLGRICGGQFARFILPVSLVRFSDGDDLRTNYFFCHSGSQSAKVSGDSDSSIRACALCGPFSHNPTTLMCPAPQFLQGTAGAPSARPLSHRCGKGLLQTIT